MAIAALALTGISGAFSVASTIMQGQAANSAAKAQAKNIEAEQRNKQLEFSEQMKRDRTKAKRAMSTVRARLAQTGMQTTSGTPLAILGENAGNIELGFQDAARRQLIQDQSMTHAAYMSRYEGKQAVKSSYISAAGQAIGAMGSMGKQYSGAVYTNALPDTFGIYRPRPRNNG